MSIFYDTHAHLDYPEFAPDLPELVARAKAAGIAKIISIGTNLQSSRRAIELSERFAEVFAVVGWHPTDVLEAPEDIRAELRNLAQHPKVVGIGETGFDYYRLPSKDGKHTPADDERYKKRQAGIFEQQLEVAAELGLNCVIHQREALADTLNMMERYHGRVRGVFHCFAGDAGQMRRIVEMNCLVSFTGILTFKNGQNVRDVLAAAPPDRFMLETDCPFLAPVPYRGKRCEPAHVKEIAAVAAEVRGRALGELSRATCATAHEFFKKLGDF
jgi:TatD DNase family protein